MNIHAPYPACSFDLPPPDPEEIEAALIAVATARQNGTGDPIRLAAALLKLAALRHRQGDVVRGESLINEAVQRLEMGPGALPEAVELCRSAGDLAFAMGRCEEAASHYQKTLTAAGTSDAVSTELQETARRLALCCRNLGDFVNAADLESRFLGAPPLPSSSPESRRLVQCLNGAGQLTFWTVVGHEEHADSSAEAFLPARGPGWDFQSKQEMLPA